MIKPPFLISIIALLASCTIIDTETDSAMSHSYPKEIHLSAEVQRTIAQSRAAIGENAPFSATILGWETTSDATTYSDASPGLPIPRNLSLLPRQKVPLLFSKTNSITLPMVVKPL